MKTCEVMERSACPTCGSCSGMFTANSMNCLTEALGLALPGNGTVLATHADRKGLFVEAGHLIVDLAKRYYEQDDASVLPRSDRELQGVRECDDARHRHGRIDQHGPAPARRRLRRARCRSPCRTSTGLSRRVPVLCKVAPSVRRRAHRGRASRRRHHGHPRRTRPGRPDQSRPADGAQRETLEDALEPLGRPAAPGARACGRSIMRRVPVTCRRQVAFSQEQAATTSSIPTVRPACIRDAEHAYSARTAASRSCSGNMAARRLHREDRRASTRAT